MILQEVGEILNPALSVNQNGLSQYQPGDLVRIKCQPGALPEQKEGDGCWGIVQSIGNISSVGLRVSGKEVSYLPGDLDGNDNSDAQFRVTCERILAL